MVKHLGDLPKVETFQIWEKLSDVGISSGIWGAMNASRNAEESIERSDKALMAAKSAGRNCTQFSDEGK